MGKTKYTKRWRHCRADALPGIYKMKEGGHIAKAQVTDPSNGRLKELRKVLPKGSEHACVKALDGSRWALVAAITAGMSACLQPAEIRGPAQSKRQPESSQASAKPDSSTAAEPLQPQNQRDALSKPSAETPTGRGQDAAKGLSPSQIQDVVQKAMPGFLGCYVEANDPTLIGKVVVAWRIRPDGTVEQPRMDSSTIGSDVVEKCVLARVGELRFPQAQQGTGVSYPFMYRPPKSRWDETVPNKTDDP